MSLLEKLKAGKHNVKIIVWPGTDEKIGLALLTEADIQEAQFATELLFKERGIEYGAATVEAYQSELNTQVLARAIVEPDAREKNEPVRIFKNAGELRALLSHPDAKDQVTREYNDWQAECSPALESLTEEQYDQMFEKVKKNPSFSNDLSSRTLRGLITYLAGRQVKLQTVSGSIS